MTSALDTEYLKNGPNRRYLLCLLSFERWKGIDIDSTMSLSVQKRDDSLELEERKRRGRDMLV